MLSVKYPKKGRKSRKHLHGFKQKNEISCLQVDIETQKIEKENEHGSTEFGTDFWKLCLMENR